MNFAKAVENIYGGVKRAYLLPKRITVLLNIYEKLMNMKRIPLSKSLSYQVYEVKKHIVTTLPGKSQKYIISFNLIKDQVI